MSPRRHFHCQSWNHQPVTLARLSEAMDGWEIRRQLSFPRPPVLTASPFRVNEAQRGATTDTWHTGTLIPCFPQLFDIWVRAEAFRCPTFPQELRADYHPEDRLSGAVGSVEDQVCWSPWDSCCVEGIRDDEANGVWRGGDSGST